jgi:hypothetical protein
MRRIINRPTLALLAGMGTMATLLLAATPAQAAHHSQQWHLQHYLTCLDLLISNPARHAQECGPGHLGTMVSDSRGFGFEAVSPVVVKKPVDDCHPCPPPPCWDKVVTLQSLTVSIDSSTTEHRHHRRHRR